MKNKSIIIQLVLFFVVAIILIYFGSLKDNSKNKIGNNLTEKPKAEIIEVFYFHSTARCTSCLKLEEYIRNTINTFFQEELNNGSLKFKEINVDLVENKELVQKFQAVGSSLKINEIYNGMDHIEEDVKVWRYLNNENNFANYLQARIKTRLE